MGYKKDSDHPETRAVLFEENTYRCSDEAAVFVHPLCFSKKKICDFIALLQGLQASLKIVEIFSSVESFTSRLLKRLVTMTSNGGML